jgi:hypothetical protein
MSSSASVITVRNFSSTNIESIFLFISRDALLRVRPQPVERAVWQQSLGNRAWVRFRRFGRESYVESSCYRELDSGLWLSVPKISSFQGTSRLRMS